MQVELSGGRPLFKMGAVAFILGIAVTFGSSMFHANREDPTDHPNVFAEYAESNTWIAAHLGQFVGGMLLMAGYVALFRFLVDKTQNGVVSGLAWLGFVTAIIMSATFAVLQAVDGVSIKMAVDSWAAAPADEKAAAFRVAEGVRWIEIGINSYFTVLQGATVIIFSVGIMVRRTLIPRWVGGIGVLGGILMIAGGIAVGYVGFAPSLGALGLLMVGCYYVWMIIIGVYMWRKSAISLATKI